MPLMPWKKISWRLLNWIVSASCHFIDHCILSIGHFIKSKTPTSAGVFQFKPLEAV